MRRRTEWMLLAVLVLVTGAYAIAEEIVLTTYYPSPRGVYDSLRSTELYVRGGSGDFTGDGLVKASDALAALRCAEGMEENPYNAVNAPKCATVDLDGDGSVTIAEADILLRRAVNDTAYDTDEEMRAGARFLRNTLISPRHKSNEAYAVEMRPGANFIVPPFIGSTGPGCDAGIDASCACPAGMTWLNIDMDSIIDVDECAFPAFQVTGASGEIMMGSKVSLGNGTSPALRWTMDHLASGNLQWSQPGVPPLSPMVLQPDGILNVKDVFVRDAAGGTGQLASALGGAGGSLTVNVRTSAPIAEAAGLATFTCNAGEKLLGCSSYRVDNAGALPTTGAGGTDILGPKFIVSGGNQGCQARIFTGAPLTQKLQIQLYCAAP